MMRDLGWCVENQISADQYADAWSGDLFNQVYESTMECFWNEYLHIPAEVVTLIENRLELSDSVYEKCDSLIRQAYLECYNRYLKEPDEHWEEWEVDDACREVIELLMGDLTEQADAIVEVYENVEV